jgi:hypothetical protein
LKLIYKKSIKKKYLMVDIRDFWKWAKEHRYMLDFSKLSKNTLGKEPAWVIEQRKIDYKKKTKMWHSHNDVWSIEEDGLLTQLVKLDLGYTEICWRLGRSALSIRTRLYDLGIKLRPVRTQNRFWSEQEVSILIDLISQNYNYELIGEIIGRTPLSVRGKVERMGIDIKKISSL